MVDGAFMQGLHALYDIEIVSEEAIFAWEEALSQSDRPERRFLQQARILFSFCNTNAAAALQCLFFLGHFINPILSLSLSVCVCVANTH